MLALAAVLLACQPRTSSPTPAAAWPSPASRTGPSWPGEVPPPLREPGRVVFETRTSYSHLRIVDSGPIRTLLFVKDDGAQFVQSRMHLNQPDLLQVAYTRVMFASFLYGPQPERCLIVGLGGGSMVRFLNRFFPEVAVDVVEIDPVVVRVAEEYFGVKSRGRTRIITEDGLRYLERTAATYDVIYLDAFLRPGAETDLAGAPLRFKTEQFLSSLQRRLRPQGLVLINLIRQPSSPQDIAAIRSAFAVVSVLPVPHTNNIVVVGSMARKRVSQAELRRRARELDQRADYGFRFEQLVDLEQR